MKFEDWHPQKAWTGEEIATELAELPALTVPHYGWPLGRNILEAPAGGGWLFDVAREVIRIMGTASIRLNSPSQMRKDLDALVGYVPATLRVVVNYSPMRGRTEPVDYYGPLFWHEVTRYVDRLIWLEEQGVEVAAVLLDHETYDEDEAGHLAFKLGLFYRPARALFDPAPVAFWNAFGAVRAADVEPGGDGWRQFRRVPVVLGEALGEDALAGLALYRPGEPYEQLETIRRTLELTDEIATGTPKRMPILPSVALGSSWFDRLKRPGVSSPRVWVDGWDYNRWFSWQVGLWLNSPWVRKPENVGRFFPNDLVAGVQFWPEPLDVRMALTWAIHFRAYRLGAMAKTAEL